MGIHKETLDKKFFFFTRVDPIVIFFFLNPNLYYNIRFFIIILFFTSFERGRKCFPGNFEKKKNNFIKMKCQISCYFFYLLSIISIIIRNIAQ
jgi:hypothetical protein